LSSLWWHAFFLRDLDWCGVQPAGTLAAIRATGQATRLCRARQGVRQPTGWPRWSASFGWVGGTLMDSRQDPRVQLQWLRRVEPDYLLSTSAISKTRSAGARSRQLPRLA